MLTLPEATQVDEAIAMVRSQVASEETPPGLQGAKMLMLGKGTLAGATVPE